MPLKRSPLKKDSSSLKQRGGLKKSSIKKTPKTEEQKKEQQEQWEADLAFYSLIWSERPHVCVSCDKPIYGELKTIYMEHGLPKSPNGGYPQYRYNKENVSIICANCHALKEAGFPTEKYRLKLKELKQKHLNGEL